MPGIYKYSMEIESNVKKLLLDTKELQDRMDTLEGKEYKINLNIDEKKLGNVISNLEKMLDSLGKGTGDFKQFETLSKDLAKVTSELSGFTKAFGKIDNSGTKSLLDMVQNIDKSLNNLSSHVTDVAKNLGNIGKDSGASSAVAQIENITKANEEAIKSTEKLAEARKKINDNISVSTKGTSFTSNTSALQQEEKQIQKNINSLNKLLALKSDVKNVKKSSYSGKGNLDYVGIYHSQEEAVSKDLATKSNKLNASLNLILNEDKDAVQELESEVTKLKTSLKSVQDLTKRISKNSSINDLTKEQDVTERLKGYASAYQAIDTRLGELNNEYSLSNKQLEEYITLQAKAEKIMNEVASNEFGGVRGYGDVTSKAQLKMLVEESFAKRLGYDSQDVYDGLFKNISDANYDSKHISLFGDNGKKRSLKEVSAQILDYKSSASSLSGVFGANEDIERLNTLNSILNYIKTNEKEIANTDFTAQINRLTAMLENTSGLTFLEEELQELKSYQERLDSVKNTSIDSASTSSISEQNKVQEELKETQIQAEETKSSLNDLSNVKGLKHYTDEVFDKFDNNMFGSGIGENRLGEAAYFFDEKNSGDWSDIGEYSKYLTTWSANQVKLFDQTIGFTEEQINQIIKEFYSDVDEDIQEDYKFDLKNIMDEDLYEFKSKFGIELQDVMKSLGYDALKTNSGEYAFYNTDKLVREVQVYDQEANKIIDINNKVAESIKETSSDQTKDAFPSTEATTDTKPETEGMEQVEKATEEAVQAKKEFATANEDVQSSIDGSENPLKLEAELMEQIAKSAREAADAKKEFVEANKQVKDSADGSNSENKKKDKYAKRRKISEEDFLNFSPSRVNEKLSNSGYTILGETVNTELVDGLVKVSAKIKDADGVWKSFSAKVDADGNIFEQRFKTVTNGVDKLETALKNFGRETSPALTYQETLDKAQKIKNSLNLGDEYSIKVDSSEFVTITKKLTDVENAGSSVTQTFKSAQDAIDNFGKSTSNSAEKTSVALKSIKSINANDSKVKDISQTYVNNVLKQQLEAWKEIQSINIQIAKTNPKDTTEIERLNKVKKGYEDNFNQAEKILSANSSLYDKELQLAKLEQIRAGANKKISDYQDKQISGYDKRLPNYHKKLSGYSATAEKFKDGGWTSSTYLDNMNKLNDAIQEYERLINRAKANPDLFNQDDLEKAEESIKNIINSISNMSAAQKGFTLTAGQKELDKINQILKENSAMSKTAKNQIRAYYNEIKSGNPSASLDVIHGKILEIVNSEREAGRSGKRMLDVIKDKAFYGLASQIGMYFGFTDIIRYAGEAVNKIIDVDTALTELRKVSDVSDDRLAVNFKNSANTAKELGSSITDVISATADWSRMGYDIDQSEELARVSTLYKNVGDGIDIESANESLISTLQGFQLDASDAESIIDKFNEVANNYAIDSAGIGEALQRSAASFNAANTDLSKSIALITATRLHRLVEYMETYIKNIFNCHRSLYYYAPQYRG